MKRFGHLIIFLLVINSTLAYSDEQDESIDLGDLDEDDDLKSGVNSNSTDAIPSDAYYYDNYDFTNETSDLLKSDETKDILKSEEDFEVEEDPNSVDYDTPTDNLDNEDPTDEYTTTIVAQTTTRKIKQSFKPILLINHTNYDDILNPEPDNKKENSDNDDDNNKNNNNINKIRPNETSKSLSNTNIIIIVCLSIVVLLVVLIPIVVAIVLIVRKKNNAKNKIPSSSSSTTSTQYTPVNQKDKIDLI